MKRWQSFLGRSTISVLSLVVLIGSVVVFFKLDDWVNDEGWATILSLAPVIIGGMAFLLFLESVFPKPKH